MKRTHIRLKSGERIPQAYIIKDANPTVVWSYSSISFQYEEGQGIKIDVYAEDKEKIENLIVLFISPLLCTLPSMPSPKALSLLGFLVFYPALNAAIRRCHDIGESGFNLIIPFYFVYIMFAKGDKGRNEYGNVR